MNFDSRRGERWFTAKITMGQCSYYRTLERLAGGYVRQSRCQRPWGHDGECRFPPATPPGKGEGQP